jgi:hypothetical protein
MQLILTGPHESWFQDISTSTIVLEQALVYLHLKARRLIVECN